MHITCLASDQRPCALPLPGSARPTLPRLHKSHIHIHIFRPSHSSYAIFMLASLPSLFIALFLTVGAKSKCQLNWNWPRLCAALVSFLGPAVGVNIVVGRNQKTADVKIFSDLKENWSRTILWFEGYLLFHVLCNQFRFESDQRVNF